MAEVPGLAAVGAPANVDSAARTGAAKARRSAQDGHMAATYRARRVPRPYARPCSTMRSATLRPPMATHRVLCPGNAVSPTIQSRGSTGAGTKPV